MSHPANWLTLGILLAGCAAAAPTPGLLPTRTAPPPSEPARIAPTATPDGSRPCSAATITVAVRAPAPRPQAGQIVYIAEDGNLALLDPVSLRTVRVTGDANVTDEGRPFHAYKFPTFSNDGRSLLFTSIRGDPASDSLTQTVHVAPAREMPSLTSLFSSVDDNIPYLDWAPDDQSVAFLTINPTTGQIRVMPAAGGRMSIFDTGGPVYWNWRADSAAMSAHLGGAVPDNGSAHMTHGDARAASGTKTAIAPGNFQAPHFSPSGDHLLLVRAAHGANELLLADPAGRAECVAAPLRDGAFFAWSPAGGKAALIDTASPLAGSSPLELLDITTGNRASLAPDAAAFYWSPDGQKLAVYSVVQAETALDFDASGAPFAATLPRPSAILRIDVIDVPSGRSTRIADTLTTRDFAATLNYFDQYSRAVSPWAPASDKLVFTSVSLRRSTPQVILASLTSAGASLRPASDGTLAYWSPR